MNKGQAIDTFWNSFGWKAYDEQTTPEDTQYPHITYEFVSDAIDANDNIHATLWDRSTSWETVTLKTEEIAQSLSRAYPIKIDTGYVWLKRGQPFAQRINDDTDDLIRGVYINLIVEYLTEF